MNWDQNKELVEQILRTGMYAKLYDEETTYGYLTYLTYRVEDALFTWKKESDVDGFWADLTWEEYIAFLRREKSLVLAAQRVLLNTVIAFPASAFDFTLEEAEVDFPVTRYDSAGMLHMAKLYSFENYTSIVNRRVSDVPSREGILSVTEKAAGPPLHMGALYRGAASQPKGICRPIIKGLPQRTGPTELSPGVAGDLSNYSRGHRNRMT